MLYLIAILLPPLGVLLAGKPFQALINLFLTLLFYVPGLIHALLVVHNHYADRRAARVMKEMRKSAAAEKRAAASAASPRQRKAARTA